MSSYIYIYIYIYIYVYIYINIYKYIYRSAACATQNYGLHALIDKKGYGRHDRQMNKES